ncbi:DedA family protein [Streptomyces sp. NPDC003710]
MPQAVNLLDATSLLTTLGAAGLFLVLFAEAGLLIGFFPPGESVRTVLNPLAGFVQMPPGTFTLWQVTGGLLWTVGLVLGGYALGASIPNADQYLLPPVGVIVAVSLLPPALELVRARRRARTAAAPSPRSR